MMISIAERKAIEFSAIELPHKYKQPRCSVSNRLWLGDEFLIDGPNNRHTLFTMWEINFVTDMYDDYWGISLMNWLRSLQEEEVVEILKIQRYLQSMSEMDRKRRRDFHKKVTNRMTFQDVARKAMGRENRASLRRGTRYEKHRALNRRRNKKHFYKIDNYRTKMFRVDVREKMKRYV